MTQHNETELRRAYIIAVATRFAQFVLIAFAVFKLLRRDVAAAMLFFFVAHCFNAAMPPRPESLD